MYEALLGSDWLGLPEIVRAIHSPGEFRGRFDVVRGESLPARIVAFVCGLPPAGEGVAVVLTIAVAADRWIWRRRVGEVVVSTWQQPVDGGVREGFGFVLCDFAVEPRDGGIDFVQRRARLRVGPLSIPLPRWLAPRVSGEVRESQGRARVRIEIRAPLCGVLLRYAGEVQP